MSTFYCELKNKKQLFDNMFTAEIELAEDLLYSFGMVEITDRKKNQTAPSIPTFYVQIPTKNNTILYRLFFSSNTLLHKIECQLLDQPAFQLPSFSKKLLVFLDKTSLFESSGLALLTYITLHKLNAEIFVTMTTEEQENLFHELLTLFPIPIQFISNYSSEVISPYLEDRLVGTKLFISGPWTMMTKIKNTAYLVGYSDEEIQTNILGKKSEKLFCVKCYGFNKKQDDEAICQHCLTLLDVSSHYSRRLDAYLGYIKAI
ncbi:dimethylamine monooxygenase subunit DmmA family protein [Bacillus sp. AFS040349]|uniref:dimethylamine monooxygenase subunit DmmA family protein n=1 Tax=Bacillus sp. AFS040349 TaxID=2033502 RepID=UPI000BFE5EB1|nr:dimethylamine monooxygenase subunit DmmA family protein [Bacillus sp. AFS040349]PGT76585.1 hypothetical protein COD11_25740 [Bacillus sp. AFS040349]